MRGSLALAFLLVLPLAVAQEHEHGRENGAALVLYDGPTSGRAVVGGYTHFGFALLDEHGMPIVHNDAEINVIQNGVVLFSTTDTHEYDGLFSLDIRFEREGPYQVIATSGDMIMGVFEGTVIQPVDARTAKIEFAATPQGPASRLFDVEIGIVDENGALIEHSDAIVEFREAASGKLHTRMHVHIHDAAIAFTQGLGGVGEYLVTVVAYDASNSGSVPDVHPAYGEFTVNAGPVGAPAAPMPDLAPPPVLEQLGAKASADGLTLHTTFDPNNQVGVGQTARIAAILVEDTNYTPVQHVDYELTLQGPRGLVFHSASLHEYDGMLEYLFHPMAPGTYDGVVIARYGETELVVPIHLQAIPPVVPLGGIGPVMLDVEGLDGATAGVPTNLTFSAMSAARPAAHSEVDVTIFQEGQIPAFQFKLHTHGSGLTNALVTFPTEGEWLVRIDALPTVPDPATYPSALFPVTVAPGAPITLPAAVADAAPATEVPGAWLALTLVALVGVAWLSRR